MIRTCFGVAMLLVACSASVGTPVVSGVEPRRVFQQSDIDLVLRGRFSPYVKIDFDRPEQSTRSADFLVQLTQGETAITLEQVRWVDASMLSARVQAGEALGVWGVRVEDSAQRAFQLEQAVEIVDCRAEACVFSDGGVLDAGPARFRDGGLVARGDSGVPEVCDRLTYLDDDGDGFGVAATGARVCTDGRVERGGDCDDVDSSTFPMAPERCNRVDDDCDGAIDEGACPVAAPKWSALSNTGTSSNVWQTVSVSGAGHIWVAGRDDVMVRVDGGSFESASLGCPNNIVASAAFANGTAVFAGGNPALGRLSAHQAGTGGCSNGRMLSDPVAGMFSSDGGVVGVLKNGRVFRWVPPENPIEDATALPSSFRFESAHGGPRSLYAVGTNTTFNQMTVFRFDRVMRVWSEEPLFDLTLPAGALRAVWVIDEQRIFAAGDQDVVLEKRNGRWRRISGAVGSFTAVRAFSEARVYLTSREGKVVAWNGKAWQTLYTNAASSGLFALDAIDENDIWAVGERGLVVHWPEN
jgi:hypothetical protein